MTQIPGQCAISRCKMHSRKKKKKNANDEHARARGLLVSPARSCVSRGHESSGLHRLSANASEKFTVCTWSAPIYDVTKGTAPPALSRFHNFEKFCACEGCNRRKYASGCKQRAAFWKSYSIKKSKKAKCWAFSELNLLLLLLLLLRQ